MKQATTDDIVRLEKKINLLNDKLDRLMEALSVKLERTPEQMDKEEEKRRKVREKQQTKILQEQQIELRIQKYFENLRLKNTVGSNLQQQFNLLMMPSADRIRQYQQTQDPTVFDGLKRRN